MEENVVNTTETEEGIDLSALFSALLSKILWILLAMVLCGGVAFVYTKATAVPTYSSTVTVYVINDNMSNSGDITIATYYAQDFAELIKKRAVLERAISNLDVDMTYTQLRSILRTSIEEQSRIVDITVAHPDAEMAQKLADGVAVAAKQMMEELMGSERAVLWGTADLPKTPSSSGALRSGVLAALVGFVISAAVVAAIHLFDDRLRTAENVERDLGLTVLASIPEETAADKKGHLGYGYGEETEEK